MTGTNNKVLASLILSSIVCTATLPVFAAGRAPAASLPLGTEVESIKDIEQISDWKTLDTRHLTLRINNAQSYLLTLQDQCMHLRGARIVGVSMTNQEIWADFDHIAADGRECRIDTITRLGS